MTTKPHQLTVDYLKGFTEPFVSEITIFHQIWKNIYAWKHKEDWIIIVTGDSIGAKLNVGGI